MDDIGPAGCKANIDYYYAQRVKYTELALEAYAQELKWKERNALQCCLEETLDSLLTSK